MTDLVTATKPLTDKEVNGLLDATSRLRRNGAMSRVQAEAKQREVQQSIAKKHGLPVEGGNYRVIFMLDRRGHQVMHMQWYNPNHVSGEVHGNANPAPSAG